MKNKILTLFSLVIFFAILPFSLLSQEKTSLPQENEAWEIYNEINGIQIKYKYVECNNPSQGTYKEYVVFQFINKTDNNVEISFLHTLWYDGTKMTSESDEYEKHLKIKPKQVFETSCDKNRGYNIFSKFLNYNKAELTGFELDNINVDQTDIIQINNTK